MGLVFFSWAWADSRRFRSWIIWETSGHPWSLSRGIAPWALARRSSPSPGLLPLESLAGEGTQQSRIHSMTPVRLRPPSSHPLWVIRFGPSITGGGETRELGSCLVGDPRDIHDGLDQPPDVLAAAEGPPERESSRVIEFLPIPPVGLEVAIAVRVSAWSEKPIRWMHHRRFRSCHFPMKSLAPGSFLFVTGHGRHLLSHLGRSHDRAAAADRALGHTGGSRRAR
jgi:hypothetical protein